MWWLTCRCRPNQSSASGRSAVAGSGGQHLQKIISKTGDVGKRSKNRCQDNADCHY
jgi:hypothetical protein